uniref:LD46263p n=1 Tax=Drosophila melanogaster TaxID=7227 RepID=Q7JW60_DROME|eukprot:NP_610628.2 uncharacterized protein Dmel_CG12942 [Drosophila melanogaster]
MDAAVPDPALLAMNKLNKGSKCRACLSVDRKTVQLNAEVPNLQKTRTYAQSLKQCTNLDLRVISPGGYLWPMQICVRCCRALEVAMHFVEMALESNLKLQAEAKSVKLPSPTGELKRKASNETIPWNQFSQEFEQFVEGYEGPIEENVLYMRGTKVPRLDVDASSSSETAPKEDEVILFDVKYDTNDLEEEDENDGSDAKNNETFFENSITPGESVMVVSVAEKAVENNNNYNFNNKNGDVTDEECDLIQRALEMTLNDDGCSQSPKNEASNETQLKSNGIEVSSPLFIKLATTSSTTGNIPILKCNICQYTHTDAEQLKIHYKSIHKISMMEDDIIGLNKNQNFKCRPCNSYETKDRSEMQKHLIDHHKIDGDFEMYCYMQANCPACDRIFKDQRSARKHYTRVHTPVQIAVSPTESYACTACDKVFNQKASLHSHQRFCQVKDVVHCSFCDQQFNSMRKYELHLQQLHAVETVHECEICRRSFKSAETLTMHRKRHSERHYQCGKCSLNYVNSAELRVHYERAHVNEEPVSCLTCGNQFQNMTLLREHEQRSHQKSKVWRCEVCNFETKTRWRRRQHQYEHMDYPYKCQKCTSEFADRSKFRQHSKKVHGIELSDEQLAEMFREKKGYTNRHDAFNKSINSLEIPGLTEDCFTELESLGVDYDAITTDLFASSAALDNLLNLIP